MRMKKLLSLLLAALMVVSLLPTAAFATEYNDGDEGSIPVELTVPEKYTISVSPGEGGMVTGGGTYGEGTSVTVTAAAAEGYVFKQWQENGAKVENAGASYTFTVTGDRKLVAVFEEAGSATYILTLNVEGKGSVSGAGEYATGESVTVTAVPEHDGIRFAGWKNGAATVSTDASYTFNVTEDTALTAVFVPALIVHVDPGEGFGEAFTVDSSVLDQSLPGKMRFTTYANGTVVKFPQGDCFDHSGMKVFDCWQLGDSGYAAGTEQYFTGPKTNPALAGGEVTITAKWKDEDPDIKPDIPSCVLSLPAKIEIPYMQEKTLFTWQLDSLNLAGREFLYLTFYAGTFSNSEEQTIAYTVCGEIEPPGAQREMYMLSRATGADKLYKTYIDIAKEDWEAAAPGKYTTTLRFSVSFR